MMPFFESLIFNPKSIRRVLLPLIYIFFANSLFGQEFMDIIDESQGMKFNEIVDKIEKYYEGRDKGKGSGYKQFQRWVYFNRQRLDSRGYLQNTNQKNFESFFEYEKSYFLKNNLNVSDLPGNWKSFLMDDYVKTSSGYSGGLGRVNCVEVDPDDPNQIYVGTPAGGIWGSKNGGATWEPLSDGLPSIGVSGIAIDPSSPIDSRRIYILTGDGDGANTYSIGVMKSEDGGQSWFSTGLSWSTTARFKGYRLIMHPDDPKTLFVATTIGVYRSRDGGNSWSNVLGFGTADLEFNPANPNILYAAGRYGLFFRSDDLGESWEKITKGLPSLSRSRRTSVAVSPDNPNYVYLLYGGAPKSGSFSGLYRSADSGLSFEFRSENPNILGYDRNGNDAADQSNYDLALAVSPYDAELVQAAGINCWKSRDGGVSWENTSYWIEQNSANGNYTHADVHVLQYEDNTLYCGSDGGIFRSDDQAENWYDLSSGLDIAQIYRIGIPVNGGSDQVAYGAQDNGINMFENEIIHHWHGADGFECLISPNNQLYYGEYQFGGLIMIKSDYTRLQYIKPSDAGNGDWLTPMALQKSNIGKDEILAAYEDVWKGTVSKNIIDNFEVSWENLTNGQIGSSNANQIAVAPSDPNVIYVSKYNRIYQTVDGGKTWFQKEGSLPFEFVTYIKVAADDPEHLYVSMGGYRQEEKVFVSWDGAESWKNLSEGLPNLPANCVVNQEGSNNGLYVGMDVGIYYRDDDLGEWILYSHGLPNTIVMELEIDYLNQEIIAATFGRGVWRSSLFQNQQEEECPDDLLVSDLISGSQDFKAKNEIQSDAQIEEAANVSFKAGNAVYLKPGFQTSSASVFNARIENCAESASLRVASVSGIYRGMMPHVVNNGFQSEADAGQSQEGDIAFQVYPNPFHINQTVSFQVAEDQSSVSLYIRNLQGQLIKDIIQDQVFSPGAYEVNLDLSRLEEGFYLLEIHINQEKRVLRLINGN